MSVTLFPRPPEMVRQQRGQESPFVCSSCGADRGCDCNAPALERIAAKRERDRETSRARMRKHREKDKQNQPSVTRNKHVPGDTDVDNARDFDEEPEADHPQGRPITPEALRLQRKGYDFMQDYCFAVRNWLTGGADIDQHTREVLSRSIHECANALSEVAQEVAGINE
jgi:hypothetical protein